MKTQESEARRKACFKTTDALSLCSPKCEESGRQFEVTSRCNTWLPRQRQFYFVFCIMRRDSEKLSNFSRAFQPVTAACTLKPVVTPEPTFSCSSVVRES